MEGKFRIKIVTLNNGTKKYIPQCKKGFIAGWETIILVNENIYCLLQGINEPSDSFFCRSNTEAEDYIKGYKASIEESLAKEVKEEEFILV